MEALINAVTEFLAAIFARFGYVGRPRRRQNIRDELALLDLIRDSPAYGAESQAAIYLSEHIAAEVARYSGVELHQKRKIAWRSVALAIVIGVPFGYWTFKLNQGGFSWLSLPTGAVAGFFLIGGLGILLTGDDSSDSSSSNSDLEQLPQEP